MQTRNVCILALLHGGGTLMQCTCCTGRSSSCCKLTERKTHVEACLSELGCSSSLSTEGSTIHPAAPSNFSSLWCRVRVVVGLSCLIFLGSGWVRLLCSFLWHVCICVASGPCSVLCVLRPCVVWLPILGCPASLGCCFVLLAWVNTGLGAVYWSGVCCASVHNVVSTVTCDDM